MNCLEFQHRLQTYLDGELTPDEHLAANGHLAGCKHCEELLALMRLDLETVAMASPDDLAASILERTSGSPCGRAHELLCDRADALLDGLDLELVDLHLETCDGCSALATALVRLGDDLPAMSELAPDAAFVGDVLAATTGRPDRWQQLAARITEGWNKLVQRPRLAWEAGYVGALGLWLIFAVLGLSDSPLSARALEVARINPVTAVGDPAVPLAKLGRRAWEETGARGVRTVQGVGADLAARYERTESARAELRRHGAELQQAAVELDLKESRTAITHIAGDTRTVLVRFAAEPQDDEE